MTCESCGREVQIGDWPFCPHGRSLGLNIVSDEFAEGPHWCETLGHEPVWVETKSQLRREAAARGLENVVRHDDHYYRTRRKWHDEELRTIGKNVEY